MTHDDALAALSALANSTRLHMLRALVMAEPQGLTAGDLAARVGASPSRASFHLSALSETGLVTSSRQAREIIYRIDFTSIGGLVSYLVQDCCRGDARVLACCGLPGIQRHTDGDDAR